jgi:hypothetical protein
VGAVAVSFEQFANELRAFNGKKEIINEVRREFRKGLPLFLKQVRANAISTLPARGGLGSWVAKAKATVKVRDSGRSAGFKVKLSRKTKQDRAELEELDRSGRVRHPLYGNRGFWYEQQVAANFFTAMWEKYDWTKRADDAMDRALDKIRRG